MADTGDSYNAIHDLGEFCFQNRKYALLWSL